MPGESFLAMQGNGNDRWTADCPFQGSNMPGESFLTSRGKGNDRWTVDYLFQSTEMLNTPEESLLALWRKRNIFQSNFGEEAVQCLT